MNIKVIYNGENGFAQNILDVYGYLIITGRISFDEFIKYNKNEQGKSNSRLVYDKMINMDFVSLYDENTKTKIQDICDFTEEKYVLKPFEKIKNLIEKGDSIICPTPCIFYIDSENVTEGIILQSGNLIETSENSNLNNDVDRVIKDLIIKNSNKKSKESKINSDTKRQMIKPLVWVWCKSLCPDGKFIPNSIFNLSPFLESLSTTEAENGGSFNLNLLSVDGEIRENKDLKSVWSPTRNSYIPSEKNFLFRKIRKKSGSEDEYFEDNDNIAYKRDSIDIAKVENKKIKEIDLTPNQLINRKVNSLFENLLSTNDVVFISFLEDDSNFEYTDDFFIDNKKLNQIQWDMIGLINSISSNSESETASSTDSVSGTDLMKLLLEDGSYFFPNSGGSDIPTSIFENIQILQQGDQANVNASNNPEKYASSNRLLSGLIYSLYIVNQRNINFVMNLLFSKLSNVEICPSKLFEYYEDKTTYNVPIISSTIKK